MAVICCNLCNYLAFLVRAGYAYIADASALLANNLGSNTSLYIKKAGNAVFLSFDEVACDISAYTVDDDVKDYYGCFLPCLGACAGDSACQQQCFVDGQPCVASKDRLTNDFLDYILPAADCLGKFGEEVTDDCLTCLTKRAVGSTGICAANDDASHVRGLCRDECYEVPRFIDPLDLSACEPKIQAAMLCFNGSTELLGVNRKNNTTPFACPE